MAREIVAAIMSATIVRVILGVIRKHFEYDRVRLHVCVRTNLDVARVSSRDS